jgi:hypothetical protein
MEKLLAINIASKKLIKPEPVVFEGSTIGSFPLFM